MGALPGPSGPGPCTAWTARGTGAEVTRGAGPRHPLVTRRPHCDSRLQLGAEALGGQAASLRDRPPTPHIRTAGLFPGPAGLWPLALTRNPPPYGLPREDERRKRSKPGTRKSHASLWMPRDPFRVWGRGGQHRSRQVSINEMGDSSKMRLGLPLCSPHVLPGLDLHFKNPEPWVTHTFLVKDPNWIFMFAERALTKSVGSGAKQEEKDLCCSRSFSPPPTPPSL